MSAFGSVVFGSVPQYLPNPPQADDLFGRATGGVRAAVDRLGGVEAVPAYGRPARATTVAGVDLAPIAVALALLVALAVGVPYLIRALKT